MSFASDRNVYHLRQIFLISTFVILTGLMTACDHRKAGADSRILHDRLINLIITENLPLGAEKSELRQEIISAGKWIKKQLVSNSSRRFRFVDHEPGIRVVYEPVLLEISDSCHQHLKRLQSFFQQNHAVPKHLFNANNLEKAFLSQTSNKNIVELIKSSRKNTRSETGGVATLDESGRWINFLPIESLNEKVVKKLEKVNQDPLSAIQYLERIRNELPILKIRAARTVDAMKSASTDEEKLDIYSAFINLYRTYSVYSYDLDQATQYAEIAASGAHGYYLGLFHVHPQNNRPSFEDRIQSFLKPNIVVVPLENGYEIHILDYRIHPDPEPVIFRSGYASWENDDDS
jgi:hypothetical protein